MRVRLRIATLLSLLGLWLQLLAPAFAGEMHGTRFDRLPTICHGAASDVQGGHGSPLPHAPVCDHCLQCHAVTGGLPADGRPSFTLFDYPDAAPVRWAAAAVTSVSTIPCIIAQPRGPPSFV